jgi:hypothetical protein
MPKYRIFNKVRAHSFEVRFEVDPEPVNLNTAAKTIGKKQEKYQLKYNL